MLFGHTVFLKLKIGLVISNTRSMVVAEGLKLFHVQCIWGRVFVSLGKIFVFKYPQTIFHLVFTWNVYEKDVKRTFLGAQTVQMVPKYIWMWHWYFGASLPLFSILQRNCTLAFMPYNIPWWKNVYITTRINIFCLWIEV